MSSSEVTHVSETQRERSDTPMYNPLGSSYPGGLRQSINREIRDTHRGLGPTTRTRPSPPIPQPLPSATSGPVVGDPDDPLTTPWQRKLYYSFKTWGRIGIAIEIWRLAEREDRKRPNVHWGKLVDDNISGRRHVLLHLAALTDDAILSLIKGTLASDMVQNPELGDFVKDCMQPKQGPSIYIQAPASAVQSTPVAGGAPTSRPYAGRWLSPDQARAFLSTCEDYHTTSRQAAAPTAGVMNKAIDSFPAFVVTNAKGQKFKTQVFDKWLQSMKDIYDNPSIAANKRSMPWSRVPMEVGYAKDTITRLQQHAGNRSTNALFGLTHAILRLPNNPPISQGFEFPKPRQWELFPLHNDDEQYAQIGEILGSLICSSYHSMGGLSPIHAGTAQHSVADVPSSTWDEQASNLATRIQRADYPNVEIQRFAQRERDLLALKSWKAKQAACEEKEQKFKDAELEREEQEQKWKKANRRLGELRGELEKAEDEVSEASQSPSVKDLIELKKRLRENDLVNEFSRGKYAMEEQRVPDHIRARVTARVEEEKLARTQKIQDLFGIKPRPKARKPVPTTRPPQAQKPITQSEEETQMGEDGQGQPGEFVEESLSALVYEGLEEEQGEENTDFFEISEEEIRPSRG
ncbi:MAG: hypothetical protein LQ346_006838 [Caloplaca aetnensis]|nr:MAG: hypothetical protein LQ346_006838 [Caloplaca aetnensis]